MVASRIAPTAPFARTRAGAARNSALYDRRDIRSTHRSLGANARSTCPEPAR
jgi:hypothetical protein